MKKHPHASHLVTNLFRLAKSRTSTLAAAGALLAAAAPTAEAHNLDQRFTYTMR